MISYLGTKFSRNGTLQLDGEIRDTLTCIEYVWGDKRTGGAAIETAGTLAALWGLGRGLWKVDIQQELAQEYIAPGGGHDEHGIFCDKAQAGPQCVFAFE